MMISEKPKRTLALDWGGKLAACTQIYEQKSNFIITLGYELQARTSTGRGIISGR